MGKEEGVPSTEPAMASLRVAGAWSGVVQAQIDTWSVADLRAAVSQLSGYEAESINLISAGKNLKDADNLRDLGLREHSKLLMTRIGQKQAAPIIQEAERADRLARIRAAAEAMSKRGGDGELLSLNEYDIALTNQNGDPLRFNSESDRRAIVMGLILHSKGRKLMEVRQYREALEVLDYAEESFTLCDKNFLENVDNVPFLQIDMVWCLFMLRDIGGLGVAKDRLNRARNGLKRAHGANLERIRVLQGGFTPELAIYVRLELLEGVVAYHSGLLDSARKSLLSAQEKFNQLQVPDESLVALAGMGFEPKEAKRGLRVSGRDMDRAVEFLVEQKERERQKREEDRQRRRELREQQQYGKTKSGKAVDLKILNSLATLGYERPVVAEALKRTDNDSNAALDILSNPTLLEELELALTKKRSRRTVNEADLSQLLSMGFSRENAEYALQQAQSLSQALERLVASAPDGSSSSNTVQNMPDLAAGNMPENMFNPAVEKDFEMEDEIAENITGDPLAEYDIEVDLEGEAITEYLQMLESVKR